MKRLISNRYPLIACGLAATLGGCSYSTVEGVRSGQMPQTATVISPLSLSGETLTTTHVSVRCVRPMALLAHFKASGQATGPYPGTFTAVGSWRRLYAGQKALVYYGWVFHEHFQIVSGTATIRGRINAMRRPGGGKVTCMQLGPVDYASYTSNGGSGSATVTIIKKGDLQESLY
jgi:hypothetical protein